MLTLSETILPILGCVTVELAWSGNRILVSRLTMFSRNSGAGLRLAPPSEAHGHTVSNEGSPSVEPTTNVQIC